MPRLSSGQVGDPASLQLALPSHCQSSRSAESQPVPDRFRPWSWEFVLDDCGDHSILINAICHILPSQPQIGDGTIKN